ncbi:MAG: hypothetical protein KatS3mg014_0923 [Actinomycetota bacterium]|nr:MAG: hypothetical protein KatS3mg014_0923 [Actinomycetota bacterium]
MNPWLRVAGLFATVVVAALVLKALPPLLVLALIVGGVAYANHVLITKPKRERARAAAQALGFRPAAEGAAGLVGLPFALLSRPGAVASEVMVGPWRGVEVRLFDLELPRPDVAAGPGRFTCALAPLPFSAPHLVVEPLAFLTPEEERPPLPACRVGPERVAAAFDVRCGDPAFAASVLEGPVAGWLVDAGERMGFELHGAAALLYQPWVPVRERDAMLEALSGFLAAVPASGGRR